MYIQLSSCTLHHTVDFNCAEKFIMYSKYWQLKPGHLGAISRDCWFTFLSFASNTGKFVFLLCTSC